MKQVDTSAVEVALRTLDAQTRRKVDAWFEHLANWDNDEYVRTHSHPLPAIPDVYVLKTSSDLRIFFRIAGNTVTVIDVAKRQSILTSGHVTGG